MIDAKELAYRYDLFIAPDWRDRFDTLINESIKLPIEGEILDVNCGTGAHAIELAERMRDKGEVIAIDPSAERIGIARAKALVKKLDGIRFEQTVGLELPFDGNRFEAVIGDASMTRPDEIESLLVEMVRVSQPEGRVVLKLTTHGSFDEFFSFYWEALHETGMDDAVWSALAQMINERMTVSDAELMVERSGIRNVESFITKDEFSYESAKEFLNAPLIEDYFLPEWLDIIPEAKRAEVRRRLVSVIDRERHNTPFDVSIKATVITGVK